MLEFASIPQQSMKIRFWGTRGSIPAPGPSTLRYGGNTSCVEVLLQDGHRIILDAGSGIRPLGATLGSCEATLLLSHYHWDHIQGMPFFGPAYLADSVIEVCGPEYQGQGPGELLGSQMLAPFFPAPASDWLGIRGFETITYGVPFRIGSASVRAGRLCHPGLTFGYRIEESGRTFVYASDDEPEIAGPELLAEIVELASGADLLLHDCQYTDTEYKTRRRWGHSTPRQAVCVASEAGVRRLLLFHHDPTHSDEAVEAMADEVRRLSDGFEVLIGREGETLAVGEPSSVCHEREARSG
jgi:phosphoribosyl 1,2-cyclic phosphodiesterase